MSVPTVESFSHDMDYSAKREIIRKLLSKNVSHLLVENSITESELDLLSILCSLCGASMLVNNNKKQVADETPICGMESISRAERKRLLTNLANDLKERIAYRIPAILKVIQSGEYDEIYNILGFKNNSRLLNVSVKEKRLSDPHYANILSKPIRKEDINNLLQVGGAAKLLGMTKNDMVKLVKEYKIMPDYMSKKGILFFLPESLESWKRKQQTKE